MPKEKEVEIDIIEEGLDSNSDGQALTSRQKEILRLVAQGYTNREIGQKLDISVRTVEVHRFNLMRRLRVRNVAQLLRQAMALEIISKGPPPAK
ncbi:MAG: LuxR C-terminal-related transcriptional regulator [Nitrospirales bacterium]|nr:LuxR C-terminal-related transcriptional regulator [Nitrospirales bacterium]